jgi:hypothetical protein
VSDVADDIAGFLVGPRLRRERDQALQDMEAQKQEYKETLNTIEKKYQHMADSRAQKLHNVQLETALQVQKEKSDATLQIQQTKSDTAYQIQQVSNDIQQAKSHISFHEKEIEKFNAEAERQGKDTLRLINDITRDQDEKVKAETERGDERVEKALLKAALYDRYVFSQCF